MTKQIKLGGMYDQLIVKKHSNCFQFKNEDYGMDMVVYFDDIGTVISLPGNKQWNNSYRNDVYDKDMDLIIEFLKCQRCRYKTITDVINSRSKFKEKYLKQFSVVELLDYYKERKEKANGKT